MRTSIRSAAAGILLALGAPAAAQLPTVETGGTVHVYATFPTDPAAISFDGDDDLFVGNFNNPGPPDVAADVWRVERTDSSVAPCAAVDDPDAVYIDRNGLIAAAGSVLVGGWRYATTTGQVVAIAPGCGGATPISFGGGLGNITTFAEDELGRLFAANGSEFNVMMWNGSSWSEFIPPTTGNVRLAVDGNDLYVSSHPPTMNVVRRYDSGGALVDPSFAVGAVLAVGPVGGDFEGIIVARADSLFAVDPVTHVATPILSGHLGAVNGVAFDSGGDLYLSQGGTFDRVLRVTQSHVTAVGPETPAIAATMLEVHPNPAVRALSIRFAGRTAGPVRIDLFDARGRRVLEAHEGFMAESGLSCDVSVSHLARGVYFVSAQTPRGRATEKIVLVR